MEYPFKFNELLLTDTLLEKLGFADWWGGSGDYNDTRIHLVGESFDFHSICEKEDEEDGYGYGEQRYVPYHYTDDKWNTIYFLHELYEYIKSRNSNEALEEFEKRCDKNTLSVFIKSYNDYISVINNIDNLHR